MLEYVLLGILMEYHLSGYQLKHCISMSTANFMDASFGSIYPALKRLLAKGFIDSEEIVEGGKFIRMYSITDEGRARFDGWLRQPGDVSRASHEHLIKLFFYDHLDRDTRRAHFTHYIGAAEEELGRLRALRERVDRHAQSYQLSTLSFGLQYYGFLKDYYQRLLDSPDIPLPPREELK